MSRTVVLTMSPTIFVAVLFALCITVYLALCLPTSAAVLCYKAGPSPNIADLHTLIYTERIGSLVVNGGTIEINGCAITVYGRADDVSERKALLNGQLVKTVLSHDNTGTHLNAIAYFNEGTLLQSSSRTRQSEIVFIEGGFVSGKIDSFTPISILINDHGSPRAIQLSKVLSIRSPHIYNLQIDLAPVDASLNTASSTAENKSTDALEHQYNIINCSLKESVPPRMITSQSVAPKSADDEDDFDEVRNDMLLDPVMPISPSPRMLP